MAKNHPLAFAAAITFARPLPLFSQKVPLIFEHLSLEQGLSQNTIYCIIQDRYGFLWLGTQDGLNKFDGYSFKIYKHDPEDPHSLSNNVVRAIYEDRAGTLWVGTNGGGLDKFDREKNGFTHYFHDPGNNNSLSDNYVLSICEESGRTGNTLWLGTRYGGLTKFERETGQFTSYQHDPNAAGSLSDDYVMAIYEDRHSILWIGTHAGGLVRFDREKNIFVRLGNASAGPENSGHNQIRTIYEDHAGKLWIGTSGGLDVLDRETETFTHYHYDSEDPANLNFNAIWTIFEDRTRMLWIGTGNGLELFDRSTKKFHRHSNDANDPNNLSDNYIRAFCEDRSGLLWIGTWNGGLNKLDRRRGMFAHYHNVANDPNSLSDNNVRAIYEDASKGESTLWIGTRGGGLNKLDRRRHAFVHYGEGPNSLGHNYVWSIFEDRERRFWIGTYGGGLKQFDRSKTRFTHFRHDPANPQSLSDNKVTPIYQDRAGTLWVGTDGGGLDRLELRGTGGSGQERAIFKNYKNDPNDSTSMSHDGIWSILEDQEGRLWIGTAGGGLNQFKRAQETFTSYQHDPGNPHSVNNNYVFCLHEDSHHPGLLWLGTWGGGLNSFDTATGEFRHFTEKEGLPNDVVYGILEDEQGNLWLSTNKGISRFHLATEVFKNYNTRDGLQSYEFNGGAYYKNQRGEMFFGGINGCNAFFPGEVRDNSFVPPLVINSIKKFDQIVKRDIAAADEIQLSYKDKYLTFEFAALDFTNPEENQYAYRMEGFDDAWINAGSRRFASYTNLDPGSYVFKVKGSNNDGVWNEEGVAVTITVSPPPWKTWWAYALYAFVILGILYAVRRNEMNRLRLKNQLQLEHLQAEKLKELDQLKSKFFANISHEFRTPLTLILGPLENAVARLSDLALKKQLSRAFENGRRLLRLINQILDLSKLEAGGMELKASPGDLLAFLKGIVFTFESAARQKQIALEFHSDYDRLQAYYDVEKLEQVFYNLMSNAIKFVPPDSAGKISVKAVRAQASFLEKLPPNTECVRITFRDSGPGIPALELPHIFDRYYQVQKSRTQVTEGTGIGLALAKEMVELHYGQISVSSEEGKGATFIVTLPLGREHLQPEEIVEEAGGLSTRSEAQKVESEGRGSRIEDRGSWIEDRASVTS